MFKVVIVGSKGFEDYALLEQYVDKKLSRVAQEDAIEIVTSHSKSTVDMAVRYAQERGYQHKHFQPDPAKYKAQAYPQVNQELLAYADSIIVFWDGQEGAAGTLIKKARDAGVRIAVKQIEPPQETAVEPPKPWPHNLLSEASVEVTGEVSEERLRQAFTTIKLNDRIQDVLFQRYRDGLTMQAIGDPLGITRERVRQLIQKGIRIIYARRLDVASILETGALQRLKGEVPLSSTSLRKKYVDDLATLGIHSIGELRATPDYVLFSSGDPILITKDWVTEKGVPIYALKWLLSQEGKER